MASKTCPNNCGGGWGLPQMKGEVVQEFDMATHADQITDWTCPYCGYTETETISFDAMGVYNSGIAQGSVQQ